MFGLSADLQNSLVFFLGTAWVFILGNFVAAQFATKRHEGQQQS